MFKQLQGLRWPLIPNPLIRNCNYSFILNNSPFPNSECRHHLLSIVLKRRQLRSSFDSTPQKVLLEFSKVGFTTMT